MFNGDVNPENLDNWIRQVEVYLCVQHIDEDEVAFHEYPIADSDRDELPSIDPDKIITVLRYGSNKRRPSYYLCSEYFCTRDEIVVLKKDFLGSSYRPKRYNEAGDEIKKDRERLVERKLVLKNLKADPKSRL